MNPKVTLVGRLGADPESVGTSGVRLRVVTSDRAKNDKGEWEDRDTSWWTVKAWKTLAEQTKKTLKKGQEVMITGTIYQENWTDKAGNNRTSYEVVADSVGLTAYTISKQPAVATASVSDNPWNN
ncbi:MAG: single-stranded DNA-binding protein [Thaumarchaeota archaeon]|nr:single-stranded DNA-binding protein [Nitrososphaerota archaeon]